MNLGAFNRSYAALFALLWLAPTLFSSPVLATHLASASTSFSSAHYLNPNTGRFWTMDSYPGKNSKPLSLHKYLYCHANPVNGIDPSGYAGELTEQQTANAIAVILGVTALGSIYHSSHLTLPASVTTVWVMGSTSTSTGTNPSPVPDPKPDRPPPPIPLPYPDDEDDRDHERLYRGIPQTREDDYRRALMGIALPRGKRLDYEALVLHVENKPVDSGVTSWTTLRGQAREKSGFDGAILEVELLNVSHLIVPRPPIAKYLSEHEVLLKGPIQARYTVP